MRSQRPVIIVGCPRSGTTLLSVILHAHPRIAMPPETRFLLPIYRDRNSFGDLEVPENRRALATAMTAKGTLFGQLGVDRQAVIERVVASGRTVGSAMAEIWDEFARSRGKPRWGEKRPMYWQQMGWVLRLFPDAQFVYLVRDPRACVASMVAVDWWKGGWRTAAMTWALADHEIRAFGARVGPDTYHALRYEDLLADPRTALTTLCEFLGEEFDDRMLAFAGAARDIVPARKTWHARTHGPLDASRVTGWRDELPGEVVAVVEAALARRMTHHGYELSDPPHRVDPRETARLRWMIVTRWARLRARRVADLARRLRERQDVAAVSNRRSEAI